MMPRRKDLGVIDVTWGSDRLCVKTVKDSHKDLLDIWPEVDYYGICFENLEALSIRAPLISWMKFILGGENVNNQQKIKPEMTPLSLSIFESTMTQFSLPIFESAATQFLLLIFELVTTQFSLMIFKSMMVIYADKSMYFCKNLKTNNLGRPMLGGIKG